MLPQIAILYQMKVCEAKPHMPPASCTENDRATGDTDQKRRGFASGSSHPFTPQDKTEPVQNDRRAPANDPTLSSGQMGLAEWVSCDGNCYSYYPSSACAKEGGGIIHTQDQVVNSEKKNDFTASLSLIPKNFTSRTSPLRLAAVNRSLLLLRAL